MSNGPEDAVPGADEETDAAGEDLDGVTRLSGARVMLVEDDVNLAGALARVLDAAGCRVTWRETANSACSLFETDPGDFDAAVIDVGLPDLSGFHVVYALRNGSQPCGAVVMTGDPGAEVVQASIQAGVSDFLVKPFRMPVLLASVARASDDTRSWRFRLASHVDRSSLAGWPDARSRVRPASDQAPKPARASGKLDLDGTVTKLSERGNLTARERETVELLLCGYRNGEIAAALSISGHTVKYHVRNILRKLSLETRTDLLRLLVE